MKGPDIQATEAIREHFTDSSAYNKRKVALNESDYKESFAFNRIQSPDLATDLEEQSLEFILSGYEVIIITCDEQAALYYK